MPRHDIKTLYARMDISEEHEQRMDAVAASQRDRMFKEELIQSLAFRLLSENLVKFHHERVLLPGGSISRLTATINVGEPESISYYPEPEVRAYPEPGSIMSIEGDESLQSDILRQLNQPTSAELTVNHQRQALYRVLDRSNPNPTPERLPCRECDSITYDIYFTSKKGPRAGTTLCGDCFHEKEQKKQVKQVVGNNLPKSSARKALDEVREGG